MLSSAEIDNIFMKWISEQKHFIKDEALFYDAYMLGFTVGTRCPNMKVYNKEGQEIDPLNPNEEPKDNVIRHYSDMFKQLGKFK